MITSCMSVEDGLYIAEVFHILHPSCLQHIRYQSQCLNVLSSPLALKKPFQKWIQCYYSTVHASSPESLLAPHYLQGEIPESQASLFWFLPNSPLASIAIQCLRVLTNVWCLNALGSFIPLFILFPLIEQLHVPPV